MANSSDWLAELLERPLFDATDDAPSPLSWLPDFGDTQEAGFVEGMPFGRRPVTEPEAIPDVVTVPKPSAPVPAEISDADTGDALEDILRKALSRNGAAEGGDQPAEANPEPEPDPEPQPDPVAEAFAQGEEAGRQAALAEQEALTAQKLSLRQTFRALDQAAMDALAAELAETVIALCSQSLSDFVPSPDALKARCLEAANRLGSGAEGATLYLHPDDLALIGEEELGSWKIVGDPLAERGGLRFETVDGSVSDRPSDWRRAIAAAIRGEGPG